jgi:hypothetical protein
MLCDTCFWKCQCGVYLNLNAGEEIRECYDEVGIGYKPMLKPTGAVIKKVGDRPYKDLTNEELYVKATEWYNDLHKLQNSNTFKTTEEYKKAFSKLDSKYEEYFNEIKLRKNERTNS